MPNDFEHRLYDALDALLDNCMLEESQITTLQRPLFYGKFAIGLGLSVNFDEWGNWHELKNNVTYLYDNTRHHVQCNIRTFQINIFSSDPSFLLWAGDETLPFSIQHIRIVDRSCWDLPLPPPEPKTKFYGEFGWRIGFKSLNWGNEEDLKLFDMLTGKIKFVRHPRPFLYLEQLDDVLIVKLVAGEQLLSLDDRHNL